MALERLRLRRLLEWHRIGKGGGGKFVKVQVPLAAADVLLLRRACSRRSVPKARPPPSTSIPGTNQSVAAAHQSDCPEPYNTEFCLNRGTCFAIKIGDSPPSINCQCAAGWTGRRCELKDLPEEYFAVQDLKEAALSGGVACTILIVCVLVVLVIVYVKRWQKQKRDASLVSSSEGRRREKRPLPVGGDVPPGSVRPNLGPGVRLGASARSIAKTALSDDGGRSSAAAPSAKAKTAPHRTSMSTGAGPPKKC